MTPAEIHAWFAALSEGDVEPLVARLDDNCILEFPGRTFGGLQTGARRIRVFLRQNQRLFAGGLRFTVADVVVAGDRGFAQWTNAGRTKSGVDYANRGVTVFTESDGKIIRIEDYLDTEVLAETWPA